MTIRHLGLLSRVGRMGLPETSQGRAGTLPAAGDDVRIEEDFPACGITLAANDAKGSPGFGARRNRQIVLLLADPAAPP